MQFMELITPVFVMLPFIAFLISLAMPKFNENLISKVTFISVGIQHLVAMCFVGYWLYLGREAINVKEFVIYSMPGYEFFIDLYFDGITAVYLLVGSFLTFLITIYSRYYMHRENGYKRFFNTILFFYAGYNLTVFAGNFETLFIGWEVLGISSFLLIAFYRNRYLPVRNAFKVFSIYRLGDIAMILAMWMSHHLWHHNVTFLELNNASIVEAELQSHFSMGLFISVMILIAASVKSAQLPFSSWLPRAMEGPTPSSAIFYSSLSVHIGVFILLRTFAFWEHQILFRWIVGALGVSTSLVATYAGRVQSSVKSQIAYSSISQIGLIFVEVALGLEALALIHFAGNAFLRTYQLLVSPSVVVYLIKEQLYKFTPQVKSTQSEFIQKLKNSIYILSLKEWNLDTYMFRYLWNPFKRLGHLLNFINGWILLMIFVPVYVFGIYLLIYQPETANHYGHYLSIVFAAIGLMLVVKSFTKRKRVLVSWLLIVFNHFWIALAVSYNESYAISQNFLYLSGVVVSGIIGAMILVSIERREGHIDLNGFHGHVYEYKWAAFGFLLACLGLAGFPITPTFLGEDLIYSHIHENQLLLTVLVSMSLIIDGLALIRIYARVFLGQHVKTYHTIAHRSS